MDPDKTQPKSYDPEVDTPQESQPLATGLGRDGSPPSSEPGVDIPTRYDEPLYQGERADILHLVRDDNIPEASDRAEGLQENVPTDPDLATRGSDMEFVADNVQMRSVRPRVPTQRGLEYQQQIRQRDLRLAINRWRRKMDQVEDILTDCEDVTILSSQRDQLSSSLDEVQAAASNLSNVAVVDEPIDRYEDETRQLRKGINIKINHIKEETRSVASRKSKGSTKVSRTSTRSSKSMKLEVAAKAAELEVQLRFHDEEQRQEATLSKFRMKRDLEIARAKLGVIKEEQEGSLTSQLLEEDSKGRVQDYINKLPSADFVDNLGEPQFSLPPAQTVPGTSTRVSVAVGPDEVMTSSTYNLPTPTVTEPSRPSLLMDHSPMSCGPAFSMVPPRSTTTTVVAASEPRMSVRLTTSPATAVGDVQSPASTATASFNANLTYPSLSQSLTTGPSNITSSFGQIPLHSAAVTSESSLYRSQRSQLLQEPASMPHIRTA